MITTLGAQLIIFTTLVSQGPVHVKVGGSILGLGSVDERISTAVK